MKIQIDDLVRDATAEEIAHLQSEAHKVAAEKTEAAQKALAKTALLAKLGITAEEAALLLG